MSKLILAAVIGAVLGILGTLGVQRARQERDNDGKAEILESGVAASGTE